MPVLFLKMVQETKRVKIHTNNSCNLKCRFCYYGDSACIKEKDASLDYLKEQLRTARRLGAMDVDFSGGESTIRPDFVELVAFTKALGFRDICVITNGLRMSNMNYTKKLIDAGLNDVLFSLEGPDAEMHDYLTCVKGSFEKNNQAIRNVKKLGVKRRINITVAKENYQDLEKFAEHILQFEPAAVNFIKFNPWDVALDKAEELSPKYTELMPHIKKAIDILSPHIDKITVRYIPYCFMQGYEKHVCNCFHNYYDADEWWIPSVQYRTERKSNKYFLQKFFKNLPYLARLPLKSFSSFDMMITALVVKKLYTKPKQCKKCKYFHVCDGIDKPYPKIFGTKEIVPVRGEKIKNPMFARAKYLEKYNEKFNF